MKPTQMVGSNIEKINPMKVLTYDEVHGTISKIHGNAYHEVSDVHNESVKKIVRGIVNRIEKEKNKMVR